MATEKSWQEMTIQCPFCDARTLVEGLRERIRDKAEEKGFALPANFDSMTDEQLVRIGHEQTYPGSLNLETLELRHAVAE